MPETRPLLLSDLRPGTPFRQYRLLEQIGAGGQGVVWSAHDQTEGRIVAVKLNELPTSDQKKAEDQIFERQLSSLVSLRHPYILPMYDYGLSDQLRYMVTPYIPGESLEDRLNARPLTIEQTLRFAAEIASALDYLHAQNVVHRDLKPANILMDFSQNLYVADFGLARVLSFSTQAMHTGRGTPPYASPEQHSMLEITLQSDLYSFGVMLYEMFTRQLPWGGEKILGIQQINSKAEIPDPAEIDPNLPAQLVTVLRQLTAANPVARPASAGDAMQAIYKAFQMAPILLRTQEPAEKISREDDNADRILQDGLTRWAPHKTAVVLSLTKFAYVELQEKKAAAQPAHPDTQYFMLQSALAFGYDDDYWWAQVTNPKERLYIASQLIDSENRVMATRVARHLVSDPGIRRLRFRIPEAMTESLLILAFSSSDVLLRQQLIQFLRLYSPASPKWRAQAFSSEQDLQLARLALDDTDLGNESARLIGQVGSTLALETILKTADADRRMNVLVLIQKTAGRLPATLPRMLRLRVLAEWVIQRLSTQLPGLLLAYLLALTGAALGAGLQVYLTYRLPDFLDQERIGVSVERGIFLGATLALGIFLVKLIVESFPETNTPVRLAAASITGGVTLSLALFIYDTLFLQTVPTGLLLITGCLLWAGGYAAAGLFKPRILKMLISYLVCLVVLAGTWFVHTSLASSPAILSPIYFYEYTWSAVQVLQTVLVVALPMALFPQLADLAPREE